MGFDGSVQIEALAAEQPSWFRDAACAELPWTMFFNSTEGGRQDERKLPGLEVCRTCPVTAQCLEWAIQTNCKAGIFGGKTTAQRMKAKRGLGRLRAS